MYQNLIEHHYELERNLKMGSLLIIDDELDILDSLNDMFKYEVPGDIDVYTANSARNAIELLNRIKFDVVMTDIRMPGMNGIELFRVIKKNWPKCRVIFLTGYKEFDYLYEINEYKDVRYLLKSEEDSVIIQTVLEAFSDIRRMMTEDFSSEIEGLKQDKVQMWLNKRFIHQIIYGKGKSNGELLQKQISEFSIPIHTELPMLAFLLRLDNTSADELVVQEYDLYEDIFRIVHHFMPEQLRTHVFLVANGYGLIVMQPKNSTETSGPEWDRLFHIAFGSLEYIQENFRETVQKSISFIASGNPCNLNELGLHFEQMKRLAISKIGMSEQMIVKAEQPVLPDSSETFTPLLLQTQVQLLGTHLELRKPAQYFETLDRLVEAIDHSAHTYYDLKLELYYSLAMKLLSFINENHLTEDIADKIDLGLLLTKKQPSWEQALNYLYEVAQSIFNVLGGDPRNKTNEALHKVVLYIENNLNEDLTLNRLAEIGCFNPSYLSRIFKQTYGSNLSDYIVKQRMELAKQLLRTTSRRINEISLAAGYTSHHSFTRVFKNLVGVSPVDYRDKYGDFT